MRLAPLFRLGPMRSVFLPLLLVLSAAAGCTAERPKELQNIGDSDRCADMMRRSFPGAEIVIDVKGDRIGTTPQGGIGVMIAEVEGDRPNIPEAGGFLARHVAARCRFENGILTEFRWTTGPFR
jgi:hypothetical protein